MPRMPRIGPTSGLPSGLNVNGPLTNFWMPERPTAGKWAKPRSSSGAMRSRSCGRSLEHEVPRRLLRCPRPVVLFVGAEQDTLAFLAGIDLAGEVDHVRELATGALVVLDHLRHRFGHQVVVLHGEHRELEPAHATDLARPQSAGVHDVLGVDRVVAIGDHVPRAVLALRESGHPRVGVDLGPALASADGVGVGDAVGVDAAFVLVVESADEVLLLEQRVELLGLLHGDHLHVHAEITTAGLGHAEPVEPLGRVGELETTGQVDRARLTRLGLDLLVEVHRVLLEPGDVGVTVQRVHPARGVPGGPCGELLAFEQHDVGPSELGEVVEHGRSDDTTADDDHLG